LPRPLNVTEKILAAHCGEEEVHPGQFIEASVDLALGNDITAPIAIREFESLGVDGVFDRDKVVLVPDHFTPNKDIKSAEQSKILREFAKKHEITNYFEVGRMGIEHALLPEMGLVLPGDLVIGADSHTCTYGAVGAFSTGVGSTDLAAVMATGKVWLRVPKSILFTYTGERPAWVGGKDLILHTIGRIGVDGALYCAMELTGPAIRSLPMDDRLTMCNMAIEAGGKNGIIQIDDITSEYVSGRAKRPYATHYSDDDADFAGRIDIDVSSLSPQVSKPHLPENAVAVEELSGVAVDQAVIGSCTNGRISDMELAHRLLAGRQVADGVRCIIIPATQAIYLQCVRNGWVEDFVEAGAVFSTPTCGPCLGGHMGVLAAGEKAIATTNRNFVGRMGHPESEVYLANPAVAAASAVTGRITHPREVVGDD